MRAVKIDEENREEKKRLEEKTWKKNEYIKNCSKKSELWKKLVNYSLKLLILIVEYMNHLEQFFHLSSMKFIYRSNLNFICVLCWLFNVILADFVFFFASLYLQRKLTLIRTIKYLEGLREMQNIASIFKIKYSMRCSCICIRMFQTVIWFCSDFN